MDLKYEHLIGRQFIHGQQDCYTILQDMFWDNVQIKLTNYARPDDWWINEDFDLYNDNFRKEGFKDLGHIDFREFRPLDVFLICIPDPRASTRNVINHCAVYIGDSKIIHHRLGKLSQVRQYDGAMRNGTSRILRHKDVPDLRDLTQHEVNLLDMMLPHKKELVLGALHAIQHPEDETNSS